MRKFLIAALLSFGLISCSSCAKSQQVEPKVEPVPVPTVAPPTPTPPPVPVHSTVISDDNWSFDPGDGWRVLMPPDDSESIKAVLLNPDRALLIILSKEEFLGTQEQFALLNIRGAKEAGGTLVGSSQVELNGTKFTVLETFKVNSNDVKVSVWHWVTVKSSVGYTFTCGGPLEFNSEAQEDCQSIAATLKIN